MNSKTLHMVTFGLMAIGGLNWLLYGAFNFNLVSTIFGSGTTLEMIVYILVGVATIIEIINHKKCCNKC